MKNNSIKIIKQIFLNLFYYTGLFSISLSLLKLFIKSPVGIIITYHHIRKNNTTEKLMSDLERGITDQIFQEQIKLISRKFEVATLANIFEQGIASFSNSKLIMAITFDDAYQSVYELAVPILEKYKTTATIFVPVEYISTKHPFWWFVVSHVMESISKTDLTKLADKIQKVVNDQVLLDRMKTAVLDSYREKVLSRRRIAIQIGKLEENDRRLVIEHFAEFSIIELSPDRAVMNTKQLKELHASGFELASHTLTHPDLTSIATDNVHEEIKSSKEMLQEILGTKVTGLAYPYGKVNREIAGLTSKAGYTYGVTTKSGAFNKDTDPFMLPRISIGLDPSMSEFYFHIIRNIYQFVMRAGRDS